MSLAHDDFWAYVIGYPDERVGELTLRHIFSRFEIYKANEALGVDPDIFGP